MAPNDHHTIKLTKKVNVLNVAIEDFTPSLKRNTTKNEKEGKSNMAISVDKVKQIQSAKVDLGELILSINPVTDKEWDAFEKLVSAHKNLMKIDSDSLLQLPLPLETSKKATPSFRQDCPRCKGTGEYFDDPEKDNRPSVCVCDQIADKQWAVIKADWETQLSPVEA